MRHVNSKSARYKAAMLCASLPLITVGAPAQAYPATEPRIKTSHAYLALFSGISLPDNIEYTGHIHNQPSAMELYLDNQANFGTGVGYAFESDWGLLKPRIEVEFSSRQYDSQSLRLSNNTKVNSLSGGNVGLQNLMLNGFLDGPKMTRFEVAPFIGLGLGMARIKQDVQYSQPSLSPDVHEIKKEDSSITAQLIAGANYQLFKDLSITTDLRWMHCADFDASQVNKTTQHRSDVSASLSNTSINLGIKYQM